MLRVARWLTTGQICRRFFPAATADAGRKRLRKLVAAGYVVNYRHHAMSESFFRLGREGKRILEEDAGGVVVLDRMPPADRTFFRALQGSGSGQMGEGARLGRRGASRAHDRRSNRAR